MTGRTLTGRNRRKIHLADLSQRIGDPISSDRVSIEMPSSSVNYSRHCRERRPKHCLCTECLHNCNTIPWLSISIAMTPAPAPLLLLGACLSWASVVLRSQTFIQWCTNGFHVRLTHHTKPVSIHANWRLRI